MQGREEEVAVREVSSLLPALTVGEYLRGNQSGSGNARPTLSGAPREAHTSVVIPRVAHRGRTEDTRGLLAGGRREATWTRRALHDLELARKVIPALRFKKKQDDMVHVLI